MLKLTSKYIQESVEVRMADTEKSSEPTDCRDSADSKNAQHFNDFTDPSPYASPSSAATERVNLKRSPVALFGALLVIVGLAIGSLPVSNLFIVRQKIEDKSGDAGFRGVSKILQGSCADCHSPGLTVYPAYFELPGAKDLISQDVRESQLAFRLTRSQLEGLEPIGAIDLAKIATVVNEGTMPPPKYMLMHWNAVLSVDQKKTILSYIQDRQEQTGVAVAPVPQLNPFVPDAKKTTLGQKLFNDKRLSADNSQSCASCHSLVRGGCDQLPLSVGLNDGKDAINTPTVFNAAFSFCQFWDGRAKDLTSQIGLHVLGRGSVQAREGISHAGPGQFAMTANFDQVVARLKNDTEYSTMARRVYGAPLDASQIKDAIATYEKTLITPGAPFDLYLRGESQALNAEQKRGYQLFMEKGCASCHAGVALGGMSFEKMGAYKDYFANRVKSLNMPLTDADNGRFNVTGDPLDRGRFKVPTLRNVAITAPYFHDGAARDLTQAVAVMAEYQTGKAISADENAAIVAFLKTLTGNLNGKKLD